MTKLFAVPLLLLFGCGLGHSKIVSSRDLVDLINKSNLSFKARLYEQYEDVSLQELSRRYGSKKPTFTTPNSNPKVQKTFASLNYSINSVSHFNASERWPECQKVFEDVQDQGPACAAGWAFAVAETLRDRRCIKKDSRDELSAWDLITCCDDCKVDITNGCNGGDASKAFIYATQGLVTGGDFYDQFGCKPYPIDPKTTIKPSSTTCERKCQASYGKDYYNDRFYAQSYNLIEGNANSIMGSIMSNGPVVAQIEMYADFLFYTDGVYEHTMGDYLGTHFVKLVGWGKTKKGKKYWIGVNSHGSAWGESGMFRIKRGSNECGIESNVMEDNIVSDPQSPPHTIKPPTKPITKPPTKPVTKPPTKPVTRAPTKPITKAPTTRLSPPPPTGTVSCQNVVARYSGTFQNTYNSYLNYFTEFQLRLSADQDDQRIYAKIDEWNSDYQPRDDWGLEFCYEGCIGCQNMTDGCSGAFGYRNEEFWVNLDHGKPWNWTNLFRLLYFPTFNNRFTLENTVGMCTKQQSKYNDEYEPDSSLYNYCACCGDDYNPHPSLGCPA